MTSSFLSKLKGLDAHPKTLDEFRVRTYQGGLVSVLAILGIAYLLVSELQYYLAIDTVDKMMVDGKRDQFVTINLDIDFPKMPCSLISIDTADMSGNVQSGLENHIQKVPLDTQGFRKEKGVKQKVGGALRNESQLHEDSVAADGKPKCGSCYGAGLPGECCNTCEDVQRVYASKGWTMPSLHTLEQCAHTVFDDIVHGKVNEGCNIHGSIDVPKVAGKLFVAPSQVFQRGFLSAEDLVSFTYRVFNNSHRINSLSFGEVYPNMKNPLDKRDKILLEGQAGIFSYYLKVVSTEFQYQSGATVATNQFSATEHFVAVSPKSGRGLPSIAFRYDFSPIMFRIEQHRKGFLQFLTSLCAIVGGVFTIMGIVDSAIYSIFSKFSDVPLAK